MFRNNTPFRILGIAFLDMVATATHAQTAPVVSNVRATQQGDAGRLDFHLMVVSDDREVARVPVDIGATPTEIMLTQNVVPTVVTIGTACALFASPTGPVCFSGANSYARSYNLLNESRLATGDFVLQFVDFGVAGNLPGSNDPNCGGSGGPGGPFTVTVNVYADTDGGPPVAPGIDLVLLASQPVLVPANTNFTVLRATFEPPVRAPCNLVVELFAPDRDRRSGRDGGIFFGGYNNMGETAPSYVRQPQCGLTTFRTPQSIGFDYHLVQALYGTAADFEIIDATQSPFRAGSEISSDPSVLAAQADSVRGFAADGVTPVLLRITGFQQPGEVTITIQDEFASTAERDVGSLRNALRNEIGNPLVVPLTQAPGAQGWAAFAILTSPPDFVRPSNATTDSLLGNNNPRKLTVAVEYNPVEGATIELCPKTISLYRPPVLLLHGLWGDPSNWEWALENDPRFTVFLGDYHEVADRPLAGNIIWARAGIVGAVEKLRRRGIMATQADAVGHSMGGLLLRLYAANVTDLYIRDDNFREGDIHKLITLDTPHEGSDLACILVNRNNVRTDLGFLFTLFTIFRPVDHGAVRDLRPDVLSLPAVTVPVHAIVGTGGSDLATHPECYPVELQAVELFFRDHCHVPLSVAFGGNDHDAIVSRPSQEGGLSAPFVTVMTGIDGLHTTVTKRPNVSSRVVDLLNAPLSDAAQPKFAPGFVAISPVAGCFECKPDEELRHDEMHIEPDGKLPLPAGVTFDLFVTSLPSFVPLRVSVISDFEVKSIDGAPPYVVPLTVPQTAIGEFHVIAYGSEASDQVSISNELVLPVSTSANLLAISIEPDSLTLFSYAASQSVTVIGHFDDSFDRVLSSSALGTTYTVADTSIAEVDSEGMVMGRSVGATQLTASNGAFSIIAQVVVVSAAGDFDSNGRVDLRDFSELAQALSGPNDSPGFLTPDLALRDAFDRDVDGDLDLRDLAEFQRLFNPLPP